ncbi:hypothetical protein WKW80_31895 [Variovorax humicola]|uniref:Calcium-dependent cell adhesion molecule N-terminal domain-containing protein n=1 Tax=Variovorax humicola TaxID=1769758 RepID=A0ABU8W944_9BURK
MKHTAYLGAALVSVTLALGACSTTSVTTAANQPDPTILLIPVQVNDPALATGCWAQFYSDRDFQGDMATLVGPAVIETVDKDSAKALKRAIDSVSVGPKATLQVYEHSMFRDRTATFAPNTRAGGLVQRLGFGGRIESMKLSCTS